MIKLVFATNNLHKLEEIRRMLSPGMEILSLADIGCHDEIPEDHETLEENALQKARYVRDKFGYDCFADDTGLEVEILGNKPGVYSARYAGEEKSSEANMQKILQKLQGKQNRNARFRTVIALILKGKEYLFEGEVQGVILEEKHGEEGFGYDPIFMPDGYAVSFAQMDPDEKNGISHRGRAVEKLTAFLKNHYS